MPELPEVETVARQLSAALCGARIAEVTVFDGKLAHCELETLLGHRFEAVGRIGKQVALVLQRAKRERVLLVHLRMSGRLLWQPSAPQQRVVAPDQLLHSKLGGAKHTRLRFRCNTGTLEFVDPRRFGTCAIYPSRADVPLPGIDPLSDEFTAEALGRLLKDARQPLKPWLLRQDRIVGLGNIYASEILFRAGISPFCIAGALRASAVRRLHDQIRSTLSAAIEMCGTTFSDFQQSNGESGGFQEFLTVYEREGLPCVRCKLPIERTVQAGRSSYYCPKCQR